MVTASAAVLATVAVGSTGAYFTGQASTATQTGTLANLTPVNSVTATKVGDTAGQSSQVSWDSATAQAWSAANPSASVGYTVKRSLTQDFSSAPTVYAGADRTVTDKVGNKLVGAREVSNVVGTLRQDGYYALIGGSVYLWGQIKRGDLAETYVGLPSNTPVAVPGLTEPVTQLAAGRDHACALTQSAQVWCVGFNDKGQLGRNSTTPSATMAAVVDSNGVFTGKVIKSIDAGEHYTCALTTDGTVGCWGDNTNGQLGIPRTTATSSNVPVKLIDGNGVFTTYKPAQLTTGATHACVLKGSSAGANGAVTQAPTGETVACWGYNNWRQLGANATKDGAATASNPNPVNVPDPNGVLVNVTKINAGHAVTCVVNDGATSPNVGCWGGGGLGVLGDGIANETASPTKILGTATGFTNVDVGLTHACATKGSTVSCWGQSSHGQLGRGVATGDSTLFAPIEPLDLAYLIGDDPIVSIATAWTTTCLNSSRGALVCFGNAQQSQILGKTGTQNSPVYANANSADYRPNEVTTAMAAGNDGMMVMAVINGVTTYFGKSYNDTIIPQADSPVAVKNVPANARLVTAGERHGCALIGDNEIWCFGDNAEGNLGNGGTTDSFDAVRVQDPDGVFAGKIIRKIDAGVTYTCALATDGTIGCWGDNAFNQISSTNTVDRTRITKLADSAGSPYSVFVGTGNQAVDIATAGYSVCAARQAAAPVCWGQNDIGQLGDNSITNRSSPVVISGSVFSAGVKAIDGGWKTMCALNTAGKAYCWGRAGWGETGTQLRDNSAVRVPTAINSTGTFDSITIGTRQGCAYAGSAVTCWGDNDYGELGRGIDGSPDTALAPGAAVDTNGVFTGGVAAISSGWQMTCALSTSRALSCWGRNDNGQIGQGTATVMVTTPALVKRQGLLVTGATLSCLDGAVKIDDFNCSLAPGRTYYYQVTYTVNGADKWVSQAKVGTRS